VVELRVDHARYGFEQEDLFEVGRIRFMRAQVTVVTAVVLWALSLTGLPFGTARAGALVPPPGWTCDPGYYGTDDGCDCGCGAVDPDCAGATVASCDYCGETGACDEGDDSCSTIDPNNNSVCVLSGWTCDPGYYGTGDGCDCGCGYLDPDCTDATVGSCQWCGETGACDERDLSCSTIDPTQNWQCVPPPQVPPEWTCNPFWYGANDGCDCGCGALDPDCTDATVGSCQWCGQAGACFPGWTSCYRIEPTQNWQCLQVPPGWTCDPDYYSAGPNDGCDCGCGALDPDCADATVGSCQWCGETGACDEGDLSCSTIVAPYNWLCQAHRAEISGVPAASQRGLIALCVLLAAVGFSSLLSVRYRRRS